MRPASLISSKMIEREVNQDSDTRFTIRLIESTRNSLPARGLRFPNLDRFNRPIVFRLNVTNGPVLPAGRIYTKQGIVSPFDFDSLFEPGPPRGSTTPTFEIVFAFGRRRPRSGIVRTMAWLTRASRPLLSCPLLLSALQTFGSGAIDNKCRIMIR